MENIILEYRPISFLKFVRTYNGSFPSTFAELKPSQFVAIAQLINGTISETQFLKIMTGIPKISTDLLSDFDIFSLMQLFDPFMEVKPYDTFIIPEIHVKVKYFYSPNRKLVRMTFAQFIFTESYFTDYQTDKNPVTLHKFIASLYLQPFTNFDETKITENSTIISGTKPEILDAIVINYVLIREWLAQSYPLVFQEGEPEEVKKQPKTHKNPGNTGWIKIFENIVGDDLINHDRYAMLPLHNVLRWMTNKIKESLRRK